MEIVLKLKAVADKRDQVTLGFLYAVARNIVRTYWRKKYREGEGSVVFTMETRGR